jgi:hypothetical protein
MQKSKTRLNGLFFYFNTHAICYPSFMSKFSRNAIWLCACITLTSLYFPAGILPASSESAKETISPRSESAVPTDVKFDAEWYLSTYPDVRAAVQAGSIKSALDHYRASGFFEKRLPSKPVVDEAWYLQTYPDVAQAIREGRETSAYDHFVKSGYRDGRIPSKPVVDEEWYLQTYPDVAQAIREGRETSAYDHFVKSGYREGRMPSSPDTKR